MATNTLSPIRVTTPSVLDTAELADGLASALTGNHPELDAAGDAWDYETARGEHPGLIAWDKFTNEVVDEVLPEVQRLLREALERRLPWTWEPER